MSDRFDLEQQIMRCWDVVEDLKTVSEYINQMSPAERENILIGMGELYKVHFDKLFTLFEGCISNGEM